MITIIFIIILGIVFILLAIGIFLDPPNPYLILISSTVLLLLAFSLLAEGIDVKSGYSTTINKTTSNSINQTDINETTTEVVIDNYTNLNRSEIRISGLIIVLILLSLYLAWLGVGLMIDQNKGL